MSDSNGRILKKKLVQLRRAAQRINPTEGDGGSTKKKQNTGADASPPELASRKRPRSPSPEEQVLNKKSRKIKVAKRRTPKMASSPTSGLDGSKGATSSATSTRAKKRARSPSSVDENEPNIVKRLKAMAKLVCIEELLPLEASKKLLLLDLDHTLIHHNTPRPGLMRFLKDVSKFYNVGLWSASSMQRIRRVMDEFDMTPEQGVKIKLLIDNKAMPQVLDKGKWIYCKPLRIIWERFEAFDQTNSILVDDLERNFKLNQDNGLLIAPFNKESLTGSPDQVLEGLGAHLIKVANSTDDVRPVNQKWRKYQSKLKKKPQISKK